MIIDPPRIHGPRGPVKKGEIVVIRSLIKHPMESGLLQNKETGQRVPPHYISSVTVKYGGKVVLKSVWTGAISKNPFFAFSLRAEQSGQVEVTWKDNRDQEFVASTAITVL